MLVTPLQLRCARVATEQRLSEKDAADAIASADANRLDYLRRFYGEKTELPTHYDVVVNTDRLRLPRLQCSSPPPPAAEPDGARTPSSSATTSSSLTW